MENIFFCHFVSRKIQRTQIKEHSLFDGCFHFPLGSSGGYLGTNLNCFLVYMFHQANYIRHFHI